MNQDIPLLVHKESTPIEWRSGNLGVDFLMKVVRGETPPPLDERVQDLELLQELGISSVEDYVGWWPLEPREEEFCVEPYLEHAREVRRRGMKYAVYPWIHALPPWVLERDDWVPFTCARTGVTTFAPSIWAPFTRWAYRRVYQALAERLGPWISAFYIAGPADYGEVGFPTGMARWVVPYPSSHDSEGHGPWCGDRFAQQSLRRFLRLRYRNPRALKQAWNLDRIPEDDEVWPIPDPSSPPLARMDFQRWYTGSMTHFIRFAAGLAQRLFPGVSVEFRIGHGSEWLPFGHDIDDLADLAGRHNIALRSTQASLTYFNQKRLSTPCRHLGIDFSSEPIVDRVRREFVERVFKDLSTAADAVFEYPQHLRDCRDLLASSKRWFQGEPAIVGAALIFPTTDHRVRPHEALPPALYKAAEDFREMFDYDVVGEPLIQRGGLSRYRVIYLLEGGFYQESTLQAIRHWVEQGGILVSMGETAIVPWGEEPEHEGSEYEGFWAKVQTRHRLRQVTYRGAPVAEAQLWFGDDAVLYDLSGDWHGPEAARHFWPDAGVEDRCRWMGREGQVRIPVRANKRYRILIECAHSPLASPRSASFRVDGGEATAIEHGPHLFEFEHASLGSLLNLQFEAETFRFGEDVRDLGMVIRRIEVHECGVSENKEKASPGTRSSLWAQVSSEEMDSLRQRVGYGWVFAVSRHDRPTLAAIAMWVWDWAHQGIEAVRDGERDGTWTTAFGDHLLVLNRGDLPISKTISCQGRKIELDLPAYGLVRADLKGEVHDVLIP